MKNFLSVFTSLLILVFAIQSCNQPKVDTAKELATIDSLANVKLTAYSDSLNMICMDNIMVLAQARADSMMTAAMKKSASTGSKPKPKPVASKPASNNSTTSVGTKGEGTSDNKVVGTKGQDGKGENKVIGTKGNPVVPKDTIKPK